MNINTINIELPKKGSPRWTRWTRKNGPPADEGTRRGNHFSRRAAAEGDINEIIIISAIIISIIIDIIRLWQL